MRIRSISYSLKGSNRYNDYDISTVNLVDKNLIVGKNSTGKSRLVQLISSIAKMIAQKTSFLYGGQFELSFEENDYIYLYSLWIEKGEVKIEKLQKGGLLIIDRTEAYCSIYSSFENNLITIAPPRDKLILHVRRDTKEYPDFETLISWAEHTHGFKFGNISPHSYYIDREIDRLTSVDEIPKLFEEIYFRDDNTVLNVIKNMQDIGYDVAKISTDIASDNQSLHVRESYMSKAIPQGEMSQGMFRVMALFIFLEYISTEKVSTLIIDDLCEGLDYDRASKLGEYLFNSEKFKNIQLIATSNDSFLMDVIDIKHWNVLVRNGSKVDSFNYIKNKVLFQDFRYSGLSNFDFFSSDYIASKVNE